MCSKAAAVLLSFIHCVLLLTLFVVVFVFGPCLVMQYSVSFLVLHLAEEERAGCYTFLLDIMWLFVFCFSSLWGRRLVCSV